MRIGSPSRDGRLGVLWHLAWPAIMEQIMGTLVSFVDTAMVGALGANATAAVAINATSIWLINGILAGIGVGYSVQVANAIGAQDDSRARAVMRQGVLAVVVVGLIAFGLLEGLAGFIPRWLGAEPEVYPQAVSYLRWYALGMPFVAALSVFSAILRCAGDTKTPLVLNSMANISNIIFNFFLIYETRTVSLFGSEFTVPGVGMGVRGAALGSALAFCVAAVCIMCRVLLNKSKPLVCSPEDNWKPMPDVIKQAVRLGLPYAGERAVVNLGQICMTWVVAQVGTVALAANQIAVNAEAVCYLPAYGISFAATALVGQSVGAKSKEDAQAYGSLAAWLSFWICLATAAVLFLVAYPLAGIFTPDEAVIAETAKVLRIVCLCEPFFALSIVCSGALRGAHDVRCPMFISLGTMWGLRVTLSFLFVFVFHWGLAGVWGAMTIELIARGALCLLRWRSKKWVRISGLEE